MGLEFLLILAALGFSAYAGIMKKKREAQNNRRTETAESESDPWTELKEKIESMRTPVAGSKGHQTVVVNTDADLDSPWYYETKPDKPTVSKPQPKQDKRKKTVASNATKRPSQDQVIPTIQDERDDILDRFNLRDAVIFSEILKPKYKEDNI